MTPGPDSAATGLAAGAAGAPYVLERPDLGLWVVAVPDTAADEAEAGSLLADLKALDGGLAQGDAARLVRRRLEQEALRLGHRRTSAGRTGGIAVIAALASPPHLLCLRIGACGLVRFDGPKPELLAFPAEAGDAPGVDVLRSSLDPGTILALVSPALADAMGDGSRHVAAGRMPPPIAARFLLQRAEAGAGAPQAAIVLAMASSPEPVAPRPPAPPASAPRLATSHRRPSRIAPAALAGGLVLALGALAAVVVFQQQRSQPTQQAEPADIPVVTDMAMAAPDLPAAMVGAADRRFAQTARLAVAVSAIEGTLAKLDLGTAPAAISARPFAPTALDAAAKTLAARLPTLPLATPLRIDYRLSSPFGFRVHPITGILQLHAGLDLVAPPGTPIFATGDGQVRRAGVAGGYGNMVEIQHGEGLVTRYGHMDTIAVAVGQAVTAGTVIGTLGTTGDSTGPHVHYEIRRGDQPVDPMPFLEAGQSLKTILTIAIRK